MLYIGGGYHMLVFSVGGAQMLMVLRSIFLIYGILQIRLIFSVVVFVGRGERCLQSLWVI